MKKQAACLLTLALLLLLSMPVSAAVCAVQSTSLSVGRSSVVTLMYHKISDASSGEENAFCVSSAQFEDDIRFLKENGYMFCLASEVDDVLRGKKPRGKYVAVTFDDGYESDFYFAKPILEKYGAKATFFVIGAQIGIEDHISEAHLSALSKSNFAEIGSHSYSLHSMTVSEIKQKFDSGDTKMIADDFQKSANVLEKIIGKKVTVLSYPNGIYSIEADRALKNVGFTASFTSEEKRSMSAGVPHGRKNRYNGVELKKLLAK